ncbi:hypothetical protein L198_04829 [Cryptococcus wingfieldii CBS 7118]|uniref:Uncharacterized protein n=1 Tax=Cryptococcus wingfieldii CBS 7118 TaxID=1295528 RepID=A0A1E3J1I3_9TREE|nr:hypothetical protein L198_04829 [Cryptococcus wingfieldii CBS 7118]ODN94688.1 hypothetical protein L198_04829 [Cryptococcus wingfieldii CBS 7118]
MDLAPNYPGSTDLNYVLAELSKEHRSSIVKLLGDFTANPLESITLVLDTNGNTSDENDDDWHRIAVQRIARSVAAVIVHGKLAVVVANYVFEDGETATEVEGAMSQ